MCSLIGLILHPHVASLCSATKWTRIKQNQYAAIIRKSLASIILTHKAASQSTMRNLVGLTSVDSAVSMVTAALRCT